jgi:hypothetical protein
MQNNFTIVTGLWNLERGGLEGWAKRDFHHYKSKFFELLETDVPMVIWIPEDLRKEVEEIRQWKPTSIQIKNVEDFKTWNPFFDKIQEIRNRPSWKNFAGWLSESPQAALEFYNPMMFTKMFMVNDSAILNPFNTDYFFWVDGGLINTVPKGYFTKDEVLKNLPRFVIKHNDKFIQISYPYTANEEIHGFERKAMASYCGVDFVDYVCRGGFFGGEKNRIHEINGLYYTIMAKTLAEGYMGADECLLTILSHQYPELTHHFQVEGNGLVWPFFEELKNYSSETLRSDSIILNPENSALYVIGFNSPAQFKTLIDSMLEYDPNFIHKPQKFLLDNSTDLSTTPEYLNLCKEYGFNHIKKENLGICGGRQWIAEHAEEEGFDFYFFFEDDMFFFPESGETCRNGFNRYVFGLYEKSLEIIKKFEFDFLKLNYSEFYGDNGTQWSWYNVPQCIRDKFFPEKPNLPQMGQDPNAPRTLFKNIRSHKGISFVDGDVYYCNWPQIVSKIGNRKMFLTEKWEKPYEQTWMSYMFQETKAGNLNPGLLLLTPTEHNRFHHYDGKLRKES